MRLGKLIWTRVRNHAPFLDRPEQFVAQEGEWTVRCDVAAADSLSCALRRVEVVQEGPALPPDALGQRADWICGHVTYLLEPLRTVELDARRGLALLRSAQPRRDEDRISYSELLTSATRRTTLQRFGCRPTQSDRQTVDFILTSDQLVALLDDLARMGAKGVG